MRWYLIKQLCLELITVCGDGGGWIIFFFWKIAFFVVPCVQVSHKRVLAFRFPFRTLSVVGKCRFLLKVCRDK
jgi:hypothetical protein